MDQCLPTKKRNCFNAVILSDYTAVMKWHTQPCKAVCRSLLRAVQLFWNSRICEQGACVTYLCSMGTAEWIASPHHIFDALHFLLVAAAVLHGPFLRLLQCTLQRLNSLSCRPKAFLQLWKLTAKICIVTDQLSHTHKSTFSMPTGIDITCQWPCSITSYI